MAGTAKAPLYTVVGDVVGSRKIADQTAALRQVRETLDWVNLRVNAHFQMRPGIGDEFQGAYKGIREALLATLLISLRLKGSLDVRFGVGWGPVEVVDPDQAPVGQSGPGWWRAREAIQEVAVIQSRAKGWPAAMRSRFIAADHPLMGSINALLLCRDQVLSMMDKKDARIAIALFLNEPQTQIAAELDISQSAVSHRQRKRGASTLLKADEALAALGASQE